MNVVVGSEVESRYDRPNCTVIKSGASRDHSLETIVHPINEPFLSLLLLEIFVAVQRKAGNPAPVSLHYQTPGGTAGSGQALVDSGHHASTDSPHLVLFRPLEL
jgi:hypothetical protein